MTADDSYEAPFDEASQDSVTSVDAEAAISDEGESPEIDRADKSAIDPEVQKARNAFETDDDAYEDVDDEVQESVAVEATEVEAVAAEAVTSEVGEAEEGSVESVADDDAEEQLAQLATPFVGRWNELISTTNWEKGRIISDWRGALIASGVGSDQYSDEAWARRVGGVTAPHVGRLRRVYDHFGSTFTTYAGLYWSHFLAALEWEDAPLWLEGAVQSGWSVAGMREQRWQAHGAVDSQRPTASQIVSVDTDEDVVEPAQGAGGTREYGDEPGTAMGKTYEDADFGDEEELQSLAGGTELPNPGGLGVPPENAEAAPSLVQPFAGLPELPDDLADAIEMMKLAILRHKSNKWEKVDIEVVAKYLEAVGVLMRAP
ncbi:hypothetical protein Poly51_10180 [Rubripirellula tenax]|uniref:Uncharacterized protein n=1 Tax=Rubripirellula tenax TaxID=2528015 RepID=A0A5C6FL54_9BACT|nr:hypothetical protein [Rubripirellula tenax]TWU60737.1 hypothetical protein Poly51_10180 [Rubripirellula tenax]